MAHDPKVDSKLQRAFERSLAAVIGDSGTKAIIKLRRFPGDKFDPRAIDRSLTQIFGGSREGLSTVQMDVLNGMSSALDIGEEGQSITTGNFAELLQTMAYRYRIKEHAGLAGVGFAAGVVSSICCLGPMAFALLGLASLSASLTLAMGLTSQFKPIELGASVSLLALTTFFRLRRHQECSLSGLRRNLAYVVIPGSVFLVTYALVNYLVGITFSSGAASLLH